MFSFWSVTSSCVTDRYPFISIIRMTQVLYTSISLIIPVLWLWHHAGYSKCDTLCGTYCRCHLRHVLSIWACDCARRHCHCHYYHDDCYLQRCKLVKEQIDREPQTLLTHLRRKAPKKNKRKTQALFSLSPPLFSPHFFFGLYLLYLYIKQFQIL